MERWVARERVRLSLTGGVSDGNWRALEQLAPVELVVEDTGTAGSVTTLRHGLGRVPVGALVVNSAVASASGPVGWYRDAADADWTATELSVRFDVSNAAVRLLVF